MNHRMLPRPILMASRSHQPSRSFTLVEMLITIGIIVILAALTVSASVALMSKSEVDRTKTILTLLDIAMQEWEMTADRKLMWGVDPDPFDDVHPFEISDGSPHVFTLSQVLSVIRRTDRVRDILSRIEPDLMYTYDQSQPIPPWLPVNPDVDDPDPFLGWGNPRAIVEMGMADGELAILDAWGAPIRAVHPVRRRQLAR